MDRCQRTDATELSQPVAASVSAPKQLVENSRSVKVHGALGWAGVCERDASSAVCDYHKGLPSRVPAILFDQITISSLAREKPDQYSVRLSLREFYTTGVEPRQASLDMVDRSLDSDEGIFRVLDSRVSLQVIKSVGPVKTETDSPSIGGNVMKLARLVNGATQEYQTVLAE